LRPNIISAGANPNEKHFLNEIRKRDGIFVCTIATTETAQIPNISAAGATPELRKYTAQADVEYLFYEKALTIPEIPKNPLGPPSPVIITKAALNLTQMPVFIIDAGCEVKAQVPAFVLREKGLKCITTGQSFDRGKELQELSAKLAQEFVRLNRYVVLGESVPGGTTTALSLMSLMGINAHGKVSSSMVENAHDLKQEVVERAHKNAGINGEYLHNYPIVAVEKIGDSMQIVNAVLAITMSEHVPVLLAGGTQMLAVVALMRVMGKNYPHKIRWENIGVCTTRWVLEDINADFKGLAKASSDYASFFAANMNFSQSRFEALRRYEEGLVKEGVGAGGIAGAGFIKKAFTSKTLMDEIERLYKRMG
jgi:uncharacterized protein (TIGR00303 family)